MDVILREDIETLGRRGQVVKVAAGYARNFLLPKRLAVAATGANKKIVEQERQAALRREAKEQGAAEELAKLLSTVTLTTVQKAASRTRCSAASPPRTSANCSKRPATPSTAAKLRSMRRSKRWASTRSPSACSGTSQRKSPCR